MGRRNKNIAKLEIYGVFRGFIESGQTKVTVSSVIEEAGLNRKTFYNHFANIDVMVAWGFRHDLHELLSSRFDEEALLLPPSDPYDFEGLPCYARTPLSALSLNQGDFMGVFGEVFEAHRDYYLTLLRSSFAPPLRRYLVDLLQGLFLDDVGYFLNNRKMPDDAKRYVAAFFAEAVVHQTVDAFLGMVPKRDPDGYSSIANIAHECMLHVVEAYQSEKSELYFRRRRSM